MRCEAVCLLWGFAVGDVHGVDDAGLFFRLRGGACCSRHACAACGEVSGIPAFMSFETSAFDTPKVLAISITPMLVATKSNSEHLNE